MKNSNTILTGVLALMLLAFSNVSAQDEGFIYGKITTVEGKTYQGPIRWGKEEVYWADMFNASKGDNENLEYLSRDEMRDLEEQYYRNNNNYGERWASWLNITWSGDGSSQFQHQFVCRFGEIKSIRPTGSARAKITMQNGETVEVDGQGYNDIGTSVKISDDEIGEVELSWSRIDDILFMPTPSKLDNKFGEPLYGTVETYDGTFTGYVQWDHDERVSTDKLDGDNEDGNVSIEFGKIKSIERAGFRSAVVLNSGREMMMSGSNDVNSENRGIIVTNDELGRVDIPWREFKKVTFEKVGEKPRTFESFKNQKELNAKVTTTNGETLTGRIIFDMDESYTYEILHGKKEDIEYLISFDNISRIAPKNYDSSEITLKNGDKIVLGDSQDVSDKNYGVLVFEDKNRPTYIRWDKVKEITFN